MIVTDSLVVGTLTNGKLFCRVRTGEKWEKWVDIAEDMDWISMRFIEKAINSRLTEWEAQDRAVELKEAAEALKRI